VPTGLSLVTTALQEIGVLAEGGTASAAGATDALSALNRMLDQMAADRLSIPHLTRTEATITASQASYTVGSGGNINIARPVHIEKVNFQDTSRTRSISFRRCSRSRAGRPSRRRI
jgi:hypothetical protein